MLVGVKIRMVINASIFDSTSSASTIWANTMFGKEHGGLPIAAKYPCTWPLGLDVLSVQYSANVETYVGIPAAIPQRGAQNSWNSGNTRILTQRM